MAKSLSEMTQEEQEYYWEEQRLYEQADAMAGAYGGVADKNLEGWGAVAEANRLSHEYQEAQEAEWAAEQEAKDVAEAAEKAKQAEAVRQYDSIDEIIRKSEADYEYGKYLKKKEAERERRREAEAEARRLADSKLTEIEKLDRAVEAMLTSAKAAKKAESEEARRTELIKLGNFMYRWCLSLKDVLPCLGKTESDKNYNIYWLSNGCLKEWGYIYSINKFLYMCLASKLGLDVSKAGVVADKIACNVQYTKRMRDISFEVSDVQARLDSLGLGLRVTSATAEVLKDLGFDDDVVTMLSNLRYVYIVSKPVVEVPKKKKTWWSFLFR